MVSREIEDWKLKQAEMQHKITEMKNSLEASDSRIQVAVEQISEGEDSLVEITDAEKKREKRLKRTEDKNLDSCMQSNETRTHPHTMYKNKLKMAERLK